VGGENSGGGHRARCSGKVPGRGKGMSVGGGGRKRVGCVALYETPNYAVVVVV
jgi:hypothetical protein